MTSLIRVFSILVGVAICFFAGDSKKKKFIIGGGVGGVCLLLIIVFLVYWYKLSRKRKEVIRGKPMWILTIIFSLSINLVL